MIAANNEPPEDDETEGGLGGLIDPRTSGKDIRLLKRSLAWPVPPKVRREVTKEMGRLATKSEDERVRVAAAKFLVAADSVNVKREALEQADRHHAEGETVKHEHSGTVTVEQRRSELLAILDTASKRIGTGAGPLPLDGAS